MRKCVWIGYGLGLVVLLWSGSLLGQGPDSLWMRTYGGTTNDGAYSVRQTFDGGYIIAGDTRSFGAGLDDVYLVRTDSNGDTLWTKTFGGTDIDNAYDVKQISDSGYIALGRTFVYEGLELFADYYVIRLDQDGGTMWVRQYGGKSCDHGYSIEETSDGGFIMAGRTKSYGAGDYDVYLIKTDAQGDTLWMRTYGSTGSDHCYSVDETFDGGYITAGHTDSFGAGEIDFYVVRTDSVGDTLWTRTYGGAGYDQGFSVQQTSDSSHIIVGHTTSFGAGLGDVYLIKVDDTGDTIWTRTYGGADWEEGYAVQETWDGGFVIAGRTRSFGSGSYDGYLIKTDASGDTMWTHVCGGPDIDGYQSVQETADSGYVAAGQTFSFGSGGDMFVVKTARPPAASVPATEESLPFSVLGASPNPFLASTRITLHLRHRVRLKASIYDLNGRLLRTLFDGVPRSEQSTMVWDGRDAAGRAVSPGIYFWRLETGGHVAAGKVILVR